MAQRHAVSRASKNIWDFDPTTVSGCVLWLDGKDPNTIVTTVDGDTPVSVGGIVAQWKDKSIMQNHAVQYSYNTSPLRSDDNGLLFETIKSTFLEIQRSTDLPTGTADGTYFIVSRGYNQFGPDPPGGFLFGHRGEPSIGSSMRIIFESESQRGAFIVDDGSYTDTNPISNSQEGITPVTESHITTLSINYLIASLWVSGIPANVTNVDLQNTSVQVNPGGPVSIGRGGNYGGNAPNVNTFYSGVIYEILVYNSALSNTDRQIVEGYLALKWGLQAQLPNDHPYKNIVRPVSRNFVPVDIDGCQLWLDPADSSTVTLNGTNKVTSITDKSGLGNNVSNAGSTITYTNTLGELPALEFPAGGSGNSLSTPTITRDPVKRTYFFVIKYSASSPEAEKRLIQYGARDYFRQYGAAGQPKILEIVADSGTPGTDKATQTYSDPVFNFTDMGTPEFFQQKTFVLCCVRNREYYTFSTNGVSIDFKGKSVGDTASGSAYIVTAGENSLVGDVIIYNSALTKSDLVKVEGYLMWKWGVRRDPSLRIAIPTSHMYYNFPPDSVTPKQPELLLYKKEFDPADLSPVIWLDPLDSSKVTTVSGRVTQIKNKGTLNLPFVPPAGIDGPLLTQSAVGNGVGQQYLDFSNGGNFYVTAANMTSSTNLRLTTSVPHQIPVGAFVTLTVSTGTYTGGASATINSGPFQILSGTVSTTTPSTSRKFTFTTASNHGISSGGSIFLINKESYFFGGTASAISIAGTYTTLSGTGGTTLVFDAPSTGAIGVMRIVDVCVRNNVGTTGYYNTATGTAGTTVNLTSHSTRTSGALSNLTATINYGQIPFTSVRYNGNALIQTPINHGIPTGATVGVCSNDSLCMPFQTSINPAEPMNAAAVEVTDIRRVKTSTQSEYTRILMSPGNPFFTGSSEYGTNVDLTLYLFPGTVLRSRTLTAVETYSIYAISGLSTSTRVVTASYDFGLQEALPWRPGDDLSIANPTDAAIFNGRRPILESITGSTPLNSSYINATTTVTIPTTSSISYPIGRGLGLECNGVLINSRTTPFSLAQTADVNNGYILYPVRGCALENTALGANLNADKMTVIWASCLRQGYSRSNFSDVNVQPSVISAAVETNGAGGEDSGGRDFRIQTSHKSVGTTRTSAISIIRGSTGGAVSPALVPGDRALTSNTSHFRINHAIMNLSGTAVDDIPANTHAIGTNGWGYASRFAAPSRAVSAGGQPTATLAPTHLRIGANTNAGWNIINTVVGTGGTGGSSADGTLTTSARLNEAVGVTVDSAGNIYIADRAAHRVFMVPATNGTYFTVNMTANCIYRIAGTGTAGLSGDGGPAINATLRFPVRVALDSAGNIYIADRDNHRIRRVTTSGTISTVVGSTLGFSGDNTASAILAQLNTPTGIALDVAGNIYIADAGNHRIRMVPATSGTFFGRNLTAGIIYTIAGFSNPPVGSYGGDGGNAIASTSRLNTPTAVAVDSVGNIYITDGGNHRIRMVPNAAGTFFGRSLAAGFIYTIAGSNAVGSFGGDGSSAIASTARLNTPRDVTVDSAGNVYIADLNNHRIRMVPATTSRFFEQEMTATNIYTIAGSSETAAFGGDNGAAISARLNQPNGLAVDSSGNVFIADAFSRRIRKVAIFNYQLTDLWYEGGLGDVMIFNSVLTFEQRKLVEGYISEKYRCQEFLGGITMSSGSFLHPYRATPTIISPTVDLTKTYAQGLAVWFDAANSSTIEFSSSNIVDEWTSAGGNLSLSIAGAGSRRPTLVDDAQNGLPGMRFAITSAIGSPIGSISASYSNSITNFSTVGENNEYTIITVYRQPVYAPNQMISNILSRLSAARVSVATNSFSYYLDIANQQTKTYSFTPANNTMYLLVNYRRGNVMYARINGVLDTGATTPVTPTDLCIPTSTGTDFGLALGGYSLQSQATNPFAGDIYEHIIFRYALTDQAIFQIEGYLAWKWGMASSLPSTHAYYSIRA